MEHALETQLPVSIPVQSPTALDDLEGLLATHQARILRFVMFSIDDADAAASITQDCFLKAYRHRAQFRGECSVNTWLTRIAYHLICDHTRTDRFKFWKAARARSVDASEIASRLPHSASTPEGQAIAREQVERLMSSLAELPQKQRTIFTLHYLEEMSTDEIATSLSMSVSTVKTHLYRSTAKMRKTLGGRP